MRMKRELAACLLCVLTAASLVFPASAHGCGRHGGRHGQNTVQPAAIAVCPVEGCTAAGRHSHGGMVYCGYDHAGGFCDGNCRALCPVEGCTLTGRHSHSGTVYCGYHHGDGFCDGDCRALCPVKGCALTGQHTHNGTAYCGHHHGGGFCDGSCAAM